MKCLIKIISCLIILFNGFLFAEIISVNDKELRNAIERLNIAGYIKTPINTWPILWSSIEDDIQNIDESKIKNKDVNNVLKFILSKHQPVFNNKSRPTIKFLRQVNSKPIIFKAFGNKLTSLSKDYKNYFVKQVLYQLKIYNQIVIIKFINNKNPFN